MARLRSATAITTTATPIHPYGSRAVGVTVSLGGFVGAAAPAAASTTTVPVIWVWIEQWYGNEPAVAKVIAFDAPLPIDPVSNDPSSAVAVWDCWSEFVHVTVSPALIVMLPGENENPERSRRHGQPRGRLRSRTPPRRAAPRPLRERIEPERARGPRHASLADPLK